MSVETENQARNLQYAWLESAEEKLTSVFEDLHGVCLGIVEGAVEEKRKSFYATILICMRIYQWPDSILNKCW